MFAMEVYCDKARLIHYSTWRYCNAFMTTAAVLTGESKALSPHSPRRALPHARQSKAYSGRQPLTCSSSAGQRPARRYSPLFRRDQISPADEAWALWPPRGPVASTAPGKWQRRSERSGFFGDIGGSHTDFWLCRLSLFIYIFTLLRWK